MCIFIYPPFLNCAGLFISTLTPFKHLICWKSLYMVDGVFLHHESSKWRYLKLSKSPLIPDTLANSVKRASKDNERLFECFQYFLYINILFYPACLPFITKVSLSGSILHHAQKVPERCDWNGIGNNILSWLFPFVSKCPGGVHTY